MKSSYFESEFKTRMMPNNKYSSQYASPNIVILPQASHVNKPELKKVTEDIITQNVCHTQTTEKLHETSDNINPNLTYCPISTNIIYPNDIRKNIKDGLFEIERDENDFTKEDNLESHIKSEATFITVTNKDLVEFSGNNNHNPNEKNTNEHDCNNTQYYQTESVTNRFIFKNIASNNNNQNKAIKKCSNLLRRKMKKCVKNPKHYHKDVRKSSMKTTSTKLFKMNKRPIKITINIVPSRANKITCIDNDKENSASTPPIESSFADVGFLEDFNVDEIIDSLHQSQAETEGAINLEHKDQLFSEDDIKTDVDKNDEERSDEINSVHNLNTNIAENDDVLKLTNTHNHMDIKDYCNSFEKQTIKNDIINLKIKNDVNFTTVNMDTNKIDTKVLNQHCNPFKIEQSVSIGSNSTHKSKSEVGKLKSKRFRFFKSKHVNIVKHTSLDTKKLKSQTKMDLKNKTFIRHQDKTNNRNNSEDSESSKYNFDENKDKIKEMLYTYDRKETKIKEHCTEKEKNAITLLNKQTSTNSCANVNINLIKPCWVLLTAFRENDIPLTNNLVIRNNPETWKNKHKDKNDKQKHNEKEVSVPFQQKNMYKSDTNHCINTYDIQANMPKAKPKLQTIIKKHKKKLSIKNVKITQNDHNTKDKNKVFSDVNTVTIDKNRCIKVNDMPRTSTHIQSNKPEKTRNNRLKFRHMDENRLKKHTIVKNKNENILHDVVQKYKIKKHTYHIQTINDKDLSESVKNSIKRSRTKTNVEHKNSRTSFIETKQKKRINICANKRNRHVKSPLQNVNIKEDTIPVYTLVNTINDNINSSENTKSGTEINTIKNEEQLQNTQKSAYLSKRILNKDDTPNLINDYRHGSIINLNQLSLLKKDAKHKINNSDFNDKICNKPQIIIKGDNKTDELFMNTKIKDKHQTAPKENKYISIPDDKITPSSQTVHTLQIATNNSKPLSTFTIPKHKSDVIIDKTNNETLIKTKNECTVSIGNKNKNEVYNNIDDEKMQKKTPAIKISKIKTINSPEALPISNNKLDGISDNKSEKMTTNNETSNKSVTDISKIEMNNNEDSLTSNMVDKKTNRNETSHKLETEIVMVNTINNREGNELNDNKNNVSNEILTSSKKTSANEKENTTKKALLKTPPKIINNEPTNNNEDKNNVSNEIPKTLTSSKKTSANEKENTTKRALLKTPPKIINNEPTNNNEDSLTSNIVDKKTNRNETSHKLETEIVMVNTINNREGNELNDNKNNVSNEIPKTLTSSKKTSANEKENTTKKALLKTPPKIINNEPTNNNEDSLTSNMVNKKTNRNETSHKLETEIVMVNTINNREGNELNDNKKNEIPKTLTSSKKTNANEKENTTKKALLKTPPKIINNEPTSSLFAMLNKSLLKYFQGKCYTVMNLIHRGTFSDIVKCKHSSGEFIAIKVLKYRSIEHVYDAFMKVVQRDIPKENYYLVWVHQYIPNPNGNIISLMMEYYPTNLKKVLEETKTGLRIDLVQKLFKQLVTAVMILRCNKIIHSDIKPTHILLNETHHKLKLCGFDEANGEGHYKNGIPHFNIGTTQYRAPEIILGVSNSSQNINFGYSIDVWSTACVMYQMLTNTLLFPGPSNNDVLYQQITLLGNMPKETVETSSNKNAYFQNEKFLHKQKVNGKVVPTEIPACKPQQLFRTLVEIYFKHWEEKNNPKQQTQDMYKLRKFENVLSQMLVMDPKKRISIEFVLAYPFVYK